jgi:hypothetical protein
MFIASGVLIADVFLGSQYLRHLRGLSALETGLFFLPAALALMIGAIATGRTVGTIGTRRVAVVGPALVGTGNGLLIGVSAGGNIYLEALPAAAWAYCVGTDPLINSSCRLQLSVSSSGQGIQNCHHSSTRDPTLDESAG